MLITLFFLHSVTKFSRFLINRTLMLKYVLSPKYLVNEAALWTISELFFSLLAIFQLWSTQLFNAPCYKIVRLIQKGLKRAEFFYPAIDWANLVLFIRRDADKTHFKALSRLSVNGVYKKIKINLSILNDLPLSFNGVNKKFKFIYLF